MKAVIGSDQQ